MKKTLSLVFGLLVWAQTQAESPGSPRDFGITTRVSSFGVYPCWSPDSHCIAFTDKGGTGIWIYSRETGTTRKVHSRGCFPAWSPTGNRIAFWKDDFLWLVQPDGTGATNTGVTVGSDLQWSPNGQHLLTFGSTHSPQNQLFLLDAKTLSRTELAFAAAGKKKHVGDCSWTPEGDLLLTQPNGAAEEWQENEVREYSLNGRLITSTRLAGFARRAFNAVVSPDGKLIVFHCGSRGFWIAKRNGTDVRQVCSAGAAPRWSPDQKSLVYDDSSSTPDVNNGIFILDIAWSAR